MAPADSQRKILDVDHLSILTEGEKSGQVADAHFTLYSGQLALVRLSKAYQLTAFADAFSGLLRPSGGRVLFLGHDWLESPADTANAMRGKIGRLFAAGGWLDRYTLVDNILMSERHHTRRDEATLMQEAAYLAELFRLPGLPTGYARDYSIADLHRAACVRAFMGNPLLILLEDPNIAAYPELPAALINNLRRVRNQGAAVWWMTLSDDVWLDESIPADRFFRIFGRELMEVEKKS